MAKYEVEVSNRTNDSWLFPVGSQKFRGRWSYQNCAHLDTGEAHKALMQIVNFIPGLYIRIDTDAKKIQVLDPLSETPEGREIWDKITSKVQQFSEGGGFKPRPTQVIDLKIDRDAAGTLKSWMYWCARGIESEIAVPTKASAEWKSIEDIELMEGNRIVYPYDETLTLIQKKGLSVGLATSVSVK